MYTKYIIIYIVIIYYQLKNDRKIILKSLSNLSSAFYLSKNE
jgi:hypothetical protein